MRAYTNSSWLFSYLQTQGKQVTRHNFNKLTRIFKFSALLARCMLEFIRILNVNYTVPWEDCNIILEERSVDKNQHGKGCEFFL